MEQEKFSPTIEDYLSLFYILERDGEAVAGVRLAELLGVSSPTVTNTLKRMVRDGLVVMDDKKGPHLTPKGLETAQSVMRRHMLTEWLLARMLSWSKLHKEAHDMEHTISDELEAALMEELNHPEVCPHGNPLPGHEDAVADWVSLPEIKKGQVIVIRRIHELAEENTKILTFLEENGIITGVPAVVKSNLPINETVTLRVGEKEIALGYAVAKYVYGELVQEPVRIIV